LDLTEVAVNNLYRVSLVGNLLIRTGPRTREAFLCPTVCKEKP